MPARCDIFQNLARHKLLVSAFCYLPLQLILLLETPLLISHGSVVTLTKKCLLVALVTKEATLANDEACGSALED